MSYHFLLDLALILLSTKLMGMLTRKIQMPQVVGALLAGLILGPAMLNILRETEFLSQLSEMGVIVILFSAGMGTDIKELRSAGKSGFWVAVCGVAVPLALGTGFGYLAGRIGWLSGDTPMENIFLGTVLTATSVSISVETLKEMGKLDTKVGGTILAAALIDDVLGLIALTVVTSLAGKGESLAVVLVRIALFFVFAAVAGLLAMLFFRTLIRHKHGQNLRRYPVLAFVLCLLLSYCAEEFFGVADIIGAFVAGLAVSATPKSKYIESKFEPLSYLILTPVFFAGIGINVQLPEMNGGLVVLSALLLVVAVVSKVIGCGLGAKLCGFDGRESLQVGMGMACRGEVALIVANRGMAMGVLSEELMTPLIITVVGCAVLTPVLLKVAFHKAPAPAPYENTLADHYHELEQMDIVAEGLLAKTRSLMNPQNKRDAKGGGDDPPTDAN